MSHSQGFPNHLYPEATHSCSSYSSIVIQEFSSYTRADIPGSLFPVGLPYTRQSSSVNLLSKKYSYQSIGHQTWNLMTTRTWDLWATEMRTVGMQYFALSLQV